MRALVLPVRDECAQAFDPAVIDELAAPDIRFEYSLHAPCRGRDEVRRDADLAYEPGGVKDS